jgi:hypothetical protein
MGIGVDEVDDVDDGGYGFIHHPAGRSRESLAVAGVVDFDPDECHLRGHDAERAPESDGIDAAKAVAARSGGAGAPGRAELANAMNGAGRGSRPDGVDDDRQIGVTPRVEKPARLAVGQHDAGGSARSDEWCSHQGLSGGR